MAALHTVPIPDAMTINECITRLANTGHPMTRGQLEHRLKDAGTPRERDGRRYRYSWTDVVVLHRDLIDQGLLD
jgi:hypothetical protein